MRSRARVRVWIEEENVYCSVSDNGVGFKEDENRRDFQGLGLIGIRERVSALNGSCKISSSPGQGTELRVGIPVVRPLYAEIMEDQ